MLLLEPLLLVGKLTDPGDDLLVVNVGWPFVRGTPPRSARD
jgi:hypothetical protein